MKRIQMAQNLEFSRVALGFWRLLDWKLEKKTYCILLNPAWT